MKHKSLRILMLNYEFPPVGGGAGRATFYIARELVKKGHDVDVITSSFQNLINEENIEGVRVYRVKSWRKSIHEAALGGVVSYVALGSLKALALSGQNNYDIIHCFFGLPTGPIAYLLKKTRKLPYVLSLRGSDVPGYDPFSGIGPLYKITGPVNKLIWQEADRVVVLSKGLEKLAAKFLKLKYHVIYNGVDPKRFPQRKKHITHGGRIELICVSRLLKRKGIDLLLLALSDLKAVNWRLTVIGKGNFETDLKTLTKRLKLQQKVRFLGYIPNEELYLHYQRSDIFVLPSLTESFGIVFAEAMACGLPVIGTTVGGIPEVVAHNENGLLVKPNDQLSLMRAINTLVKNKDLRKKMGQASRRRIITHFTWEKVSQDYLKLYQSCAVNP